VPIIDRWQSTLAMQKTVMFVSAIARTQAGAGIRADQSDSARL
jgi:hypothetical protein